MVLRLQGIAEKGLQIPIGPDHFHQRRADDVLHSAREPRHVLDALRPAIGSATFSAQCQRCLAPMDGEIVNCSWFRRYAEPPPRSQLHIVQFWDTASKSVEHHDYSVCATWGTRGDDLLLLDIERGRRDFPSPERRIVELATQWSDRHIIIEDKGSGRSLIQQLRTEHHGIPYPAAFLPKDDKITRLPAQSARIEAGHVWLPERASWLDDLRAEIASFPHGRHDDQVDSISQFLSWRSDMRLLGVQFARIGGV